jgi:hypothetical protein
MTEPRRPPTAVQLEAQEQVLELLPLCSSEFLGYLKVNLNKIQNELRGVKSTEEVGTHVVLSTT